MIEEFEKQGLFYLGKIVDASSEKPTDDLLLYDSRNLTTHATCIGMTGSGKTGLGITLLEEAGLDKIPAIIIDPKGDLGNLLLTFPHLSPEEFRPWVDQAEAERKNQDVESYSKEIAAKWKKGLAEWGEDAKRIQKFRNSVDLSIYTPASNAGIPISILNSFAAPTKDELLDTTQLRDRILSTTSSLLGLLGVTADPIKSREHILISTIILKAWQGGKDVDIPFLIQQVQRPSFSKIGALDVDTFYPPKERIDLSISLNNLLASPGFHAWMEGEPLDIKRLLYTKEGKPKLAIISIAHLSDTERMFFVTLLLNEFINWMRRQEGTNSLRAILYMDEIFGFFPPTAMPPSKLPMLTLLKQARAYGVGVVLVTQNPVDLDYKGLSNCGTWFIGKLQTKRDKERVIEGLKVASNGEVDTNSLDKMIALTGNRTFIMRSIHEQEPILFQTRWSMSYLRGPMTLAQISTLTEKVEPSKAPRAKHVSRESSIKPNAPLDIEEYFMPKDEQKVHYEPKLLAMAKLHFVDTKNKVDLWQDLSFILTPENEGKGIDWQECTQTDLKDKLEKAPAPNSTFEELPAGLMQEKNYRSFEKGFADFLYQNQTLAIFRAPELDMVSKIDEEEGDFRARVAFAMREQRDELIKKVRDKYADKLEAITNKIRRAQNKLEEKQEKAGTQRWQTLISFVTTVLEAVLGRKVTKGTISKTGTTLRRATRMGKDERQATEAEEELKLYQQQLHDLEAEMHQEILELTLPENIAIETIRIRPRKSDISVEKIALLWT